MCELLFGLFVLTVFGPATPTVSYNVHQRTTVWVEVKLSVKLCTTAGGHFHRNVSRPADPMLLIDSALCDVAVHVCVCMCVLACSAIKRTFGVHKVNKGVTWSQISDNQSVSLEYQQTCIKIYIFSHFWMPPSHTKRPAYKILMSCEERMHPRL